MELPVLQNNAGPILGIDLGTTHSLVAVLEGGVPRILPGADGDPLLPSVVSFPRGGRPVVGRAALERAALDPERTVHSAKRMIGRALADLGEDAATLPYAVVDAPDRAMAVVDLGDRTVSPQEIAGLVLAACRRRAALALNIPEERLTRAVITVPAYFDDAQRQATRDAARFAGLEVVRMVNEPTAAALAYGLDARSARRVAVYDLGGGTFDLSVLELEDGVYRVLATCGDTRLGGDDFDRVIVEHMAAELGARTGRDPLDDPSARAAMRSVAEGVKRRLSSEETADFAFHAPAAGIAWRRSIGVIEFQNWIAPMVQRTLDLCDRALADAGLQKSDLDEIVLVGGSTRVPLVRAAVRAWSGREPNARLDPDLVVALGAAVQAGVLGGQVAGTLLLDVTPLSLGIATAEGGVAQLISRNAAIPATASDAFTTFVDGQTAVKFTVVQGERELARDNRTLGEFTLRGIPPMPAGL
ncbi:MAG: Hsp70 family protein, partial [Planctomycetota bacterium]|nr:Hsp70 family protein [Planctomycetota bacterium]